jgi:hypothetical protein
MHEEPASAAPGFRFGLRSMLAVVTGVCLLAAMFRFLSLFILLMAGVLLAQCAFFLVLQRVVNWFGGRPGGEAPDDSGSRLE